MVGALHGIILYEEFLATAQAKFEYTVTKESKMIFRFSRCNWYHIVAAAMLAGTLSAGAAFASGKHSGGHGHDDDHGHGAMAFGEMGDPSEVDRTIEAIRGFFG